MAGAASRRAPTAGPSASASAASTPASVGRDHLAAAVRAPASRPSPRGPPTATPTGTPAEDLPAHLEVAGPALVVGGVEHERHAVGGQLGQRPGGQAGEQPLALVGGIGGGVDGPHGPHHGPVGAGQLPAQEGPHGHDPPVGLGHPGRRGAEGAALVLPAEQLGVPVGIGPAEGSPAQLDDGVEVLGDRPPEHHLVALVPPRRHGPDGTPTAAPGVPGTGARPV